jgi:hypothetical protein
MVSARRIQRSRAAPGSAAAIRSDVVAVASDASGRELATVHLTGGDPYSFTAPILAWAAGKAAAEGVRPAGALGPVEAFGAGPSKAPAPAPDFIASTPNSGKQFTIRPEIRAHCSSSTQMHGIGLSARSHPSGLT